MLQTNKVLTPDRLVIVLHSAQVRAEGKEIWLQGIKGQGLVLGPQLHGGGTLMEF